MNCRATIIGGLTLTLAGGLAACAPAPGSGVTRTYYVAADEVDWNYVPADSDLTFGRPLPKAVFAIDSAPPVMATTFRKAVYHEYTDSTFTTRKPRPAKWQHLGLLGPVLRGAVGDTVVVVFRNNTTFPASMHPHGVFYTKSSEGALYNDGTSGADKMDDSVPPGGTHTYVWPIPERAGPGPNDPSSIIWAYHSHTHELEDVYSGLVGPIIVTRRGMARPDGSPKDVDREFVTLFGSFDENQSHFAEANRKRYLGDTALVGPRGPRLFHETTYHTINGLMYGNAGLDAFTMRQGEHVRWYLISSTGFDDFHTPHWHGNTTLVHGNRKDVIDLAGPLKMVTADMDADNAGIWIFHCHFGEHTMEGMSTRYRVLPANTSASTADSAAGG